MLYHSLRSPFRIRQWVAMVVSAGLRFVMHTTTLLGGFLSTVRMYMRFDRNNDAKAHSSSILLRLSVGIISVIVPLSASNCAALAMRVEKGRASA